MEIIKYELFFGLGIIIQVCLSIGTRWEKKDIWKILGSIGIGIYAAIRISSKSRQNWTLEELIFVAIVIAACSLGILLKNKLLPEINELTLLCWNVIFWFIFVTHFGFWNYTSLVLLAPTYLSAVVIFFKFNPPTALQTGLYVWYMAILAFVGIVYFKFQNILFYKQFNINSSPFEMLVGGMVFLYIAANIVNILNFIPIPLSKHQTFSQRLQEIKEHANLLAEKYSDLQFQPLMSLLVFIMLGGILLANYYFHYSSETTLISLSIAAIPSLATKYQEYLNLKSVKVNMPIIK